MNKIITLIVLALALTSVHAETDQGSGENEITTAATILQAEYGDFNISKPWDTITTTEGHIGVEAFQISLKEDPGTDTISIDVQSDPLHEHIYFMSPYNVTFDTTNWSDSQTIYIHAGQVTEDFPSTVTVSAGGGPSKVFDVLVWNIDCSGSSGDSDSGCSIGAKSSGTLIALSTVLIIAAMCARRKRQTQ